MEVGPLEGVARGKPMPADDEAEASPCLCWVVCVFDRLRPAGRITITAAMTQQSSSRTTNTDPAAALDFKVPARLVKLEVA